MLWFWGHILIGGHLLERRRVIFGESTLSQRLQMVHQRGPFRVVGIATFNFEMFKVLILENIQISARFSVIRRFGLGNF